MDRNGRRIAWIAILLIPVVAIVIVVPSATRAPAEGEWVIESTVSGNTSILLTHPRFGLNETVATSTAGALSATFEGRLPGETVQLGFESAEVFDVLLNVSRTGFGSVDFPCRSAPKLGGLDPSPVRDPKAIAEKRPCNLTFVASDREADYVLTWTLTFAGTSPAHSLVNFTAGVGWAHDGTYPQRSWLTDLSHSRTSE